MCKSVQPELPRLNRVLACKFEWASTGAHTSRIVNVAISGHTQLDRQRYPGMPVTSGSLNRPRPAAKGPHQGPGEGARNH